jgi:hypothetical protein
VGATALADYVQGDQRHLATLEAEDSSSHTAPDENFLYFREASTGHRWALARHPGVDQRYRVYFQPADRRGTWELFQRSQLISQQQLISAQSPDDDMPVIWTWSEPGCGREPVAEAFLFVP